MSHVHAPCVCRLQQSLREKISVAKKLAVVPEMNSEKVSVPNIKVCNNCSVAEGTDDASKRSVCSRDRITIYRSKECQRAHRIAGHKQYCVANDDRALQQRGMLQNDKIAQQRSKIAEKGRIVVQTTLLIKIFIVKVWNIIQTFLEVVWSPWMRADQEEDPEEQCRLGIRYYHGYCVAQSDVQAVQCAVLHESSL